MCWEKTLLLILSVVILGMFSAFPNSFGQVPDIDEDGIPIPDDNCPSIPNPNQEDSDENGIGDACQDVDGDEILDIDDNCQFISNPNQEDTNKNGIGDACEDQDLLVEATFPPGDNIEIELPEDPDTGTFTIGIELPETTGGEVVIEITDAGETSGEFGFLGNIIDFNAPCSDNCTISFTFTQALLDEEGFTLEEVTIFHDMNGNGSFENDEAIPTEITGSDPFTATGNASFTSKFSIGGIKALAIGALAGGGSRGGSPPSLESISFSGVNPVSNDDGAIEFGGLLIEEISSENDLPTQTIETGKLFKLRLPFYEDNGIRAIQHVAVYVLNNGDETINDSKTYVIYEPNRPLEISDPYGYTSSVSVETIEKTVHDIDIIFEITFANPMNTSDIIVRSWDNHRRSSDVKFNQLIKVIESTSENPISVYFQSEDDDSKQIVDGTMIKSTTVLKENYDGTTIFDMEGETSVTNISKIPKWIKYNANWWSQNEIDDDDFVAGIHYLIKHELIQIPKNFYDTSVDVSTIPTWIKHNAGWWYEGILSDNEFMNTIQWLIENRIITLFVTATISFK